MNTTKYSDLINEWLREERTKNCLVDVKMTLNTDNTHTIESVAKSMVEALNAEDVEDNEFM